MNLYICIYIYIHIHMYIHLHIIGIHCFLPNTITIQTQVRDVFLHFKGGCKRTLQLMVCGISFQPRQPNAFPIASWQTCHSPCFFLAILPADRKVLAQFLGEGMFYPTACCRIWIQSAYWVIAPEFCISFQSNSVLCSRQPSFQVLSSQTFPLLPATGTTLGRFEWMGGMPTCTNSETRQSRSRFGEIGEASQKDPRNH